MTDDQDLVNETRRTRQKLNPRPTALTKRSLDMILSGAGIVCSSPLWAAIAIAIKLEDRGPIFYSQKRVGKGGQYFRNWKFRSMIPDADKKFGPRQASSDDPRITRIGRLLRATAMDELPQLWNIFVGDMSFVGPRALMPHEIEVNEGNRIVPIADIPGYAERHLVTPGLTGIAQIYAPRDIPRRQKFKYDLLYIQRQHFWLDVKLILVSFWISFRGQWESRKKKF